jgi:hypothetical protein
MQVATETEVYTVYRLAVSHLRTSGPRPAYPVPHLDETDDRTQPTCSLIPRLTSLSLKSGYEEGVQIQILIPPSPTPLGKSLSLKSGYEEGVQIQI